MEAEYDKYRMVKYRNQKVVAIVEVTQEMNTTSLSPTALQRQMNCYHIDLLYKWLREAPVTAVSSFYSCESQLSSQFIWRWNAAGPLVTSKSCFIMMGRKNGCRKVEIQRWRYHNSYSQASILLALNTEGYLPSPDSQPYSSLIFDQVFLPSHEFPVHW